MPAASGLPLALISRFFLFTYLFNCGLFFKPPPTQLIMTGLLRGHLSGRLVQLLIRRLAVSLPPGL